MGDISLRQNVRDYVSQLTMLSNNRFTLSVSTLWLFSEPKTPVLTSFSCLFDERMITNIYFLPETLSFSQLTESVCVCLCVCMCVCGGGVVWRPLSYRAPPDSPRHQVSRPYSWSICLTERYTTAVAIRIEIIFQPPPPLSVHLSFCLLSRFASLACCLFLDVKISSPQPLKIQSQRTQVSLK